MDAYPPIGLPSTQVRFEAPIGHGDGRAFLCTLNVLRAFVLTPSDESVRNAEPEKAKEMLKPRNDLAENRT